MPIILGIIGAIIGFLLWKVYHRIFTVFYFSFQAIFIEGFIFWIIGCAVTAGIIALSYIIVPAACIIGVIVYKFKKSRKSKQTSIEKHQQTNQ